MTIKSPTSWNAPLNTPGNMGFSTGAIFVGEIVQKLRIQTRRLSLLIPNRFNDTVTPTTALTAQPLRSPFRIPGVSDCTYRVCQYRPIIAPPTAFLFCTADLSFWHTRVYVACEVSLFGRFLSDRFTRVFRCPTNLKSVSIAPARFLVSHS